MLHEIITNDHDWNLIGIEENIMIYTCESISSNYKNRVNGLFNVYTMTLHSSENFFKKFDSAVIKVVSKDHAIEQEFKTIYFDGEVESLIRELNMIYLPTHMGA